MPQTICFTNKHGKINANNMTQSWLYAWNAIYLWYWPIMWDKTLALKSYLYIAYSIAHCLIYVAYLLLLIVFCILSSVLRVADCTLCIANCIVHVVCWIWYLIGSISNVYCMLNIVHWVMDIVYVLCKSFYWSII